MGDATAVESFEVGRFGGKSTRQGLMELQRFRSRMSTAWRDNQAQVLEKRSCASAPVLPASRSPSGSPYFTRTPGLTEEDSDENAMSSEQIRRRPCARSGEAVSGDDRARALSKKLGRG